jgi:hypothetical protein
VKGILILSDAARIHADNTVSMLRAGINRLAGPRNRPLFFRGSLVGRISTTRGEGGSHQFKVSTIDADGNPIASEMSGGFEAPPGGGHHLLVMDMQLVLPGSGTYTFCLSIDNVQMDTWDLKVEHAPPVTEGGQA